MSKISVIVPVYNTEKYLRRCVDSILAQTFTDFELLLIDDGSTDGSGAICDEYALKDSRVRVFHKENGGASSARNLGLDNAQGEWITFVDSDDWVYPCWLQNFVDNWDGVDMVCQGVECDKPLCLDENAQDVKGLSYGVNYTGNASDVLTKLYEKRIVGYLTVKCFKWSIIISQNIEFNETFKFKEDEDFVLQYMNHCNIIKSVEKVGYYYYVPDWDRKYEINNTYEISKSLYLNIMNLQKGKWNIICESYLSAITGAFIDLYSKTGNRKLILDYRKTLRYNIFRSETSKVFKWSIYLDLFGYCSQWILKLYFAMINRNKVFNHIEE